MIRARTRWIRTALYASVGAATALLFFLLLWEPMQSAVAEGDLAWMIPAVLDRAEGRTFWELVCLIFSSGPPRVVFPFMKANLILLSAFQLHTRNLVLIGMLLHGLNALLLYGLSRELGFQRRVGFLSGLVYFTLFIPFHAYLWPTAMSYHLDPLFITLVTLCLFFATERADRSGGRGSRILYSLTVAAAVLASVGRGSIIAVLIIFADIFSGSVDGREVRLRYERWIPLFFLSALHPLHTLVSSGEWHCNALIRALMDGVGRSPVPYSIKLIGLFALWAGFLTGLRGWLRFSERRALLVARPLLWVGAGGAILLLALFDRRQILFFYNAMVPLATVFSSFLQPLHSAMALDSSQPFYFMQPQTEVSMLLLTAGFLFLFVRTAIRENRHRWILLGWYGVSLLHFLFQFSSQPVVAPSRHFIYIAPVFALLFVSVAVSLFRALAERFGLAGLKKDGILLAFFLALCLPNLLAIRLAVWRGKLANNFYTYDDVRMAHLVREDLEEKGRGVPEELVVRGVVPMPYDTSYWEFMQVDPLQHRMFRFVMEEVMGDRALRDRIRVVSEGEAASSGPVRDPFARMTDEAAARIAAADLPAARELLLKAIRRRPFLLRYLMPDRCRFSDVRWMTQGQGLKEWAQRTAQGWARPDRVILKQQHIQRLLEEELFTYAKALFCLSYVEYRQGALEQSRYWLSQIWFLEPDRDRLVAWFLQAEEVRSNRALSEFAQRFRDPRYFDDPLPWRKDDYGLARFLMRFLIGLDVRSGWDRLAPAPP